LREAASEIFGDVRDAIAREKEIKGWRREKKIRLIERANPTWADLSERLPTVYGGSVRRADDKAEPKADPSRR
jgi:hypothetical protein